MPLRSYRLLGVLDCFESRTKRERSLHPVYLFKGSPMAWQCTECGKLFSVTADELSIKPNDELPDYVQVEFNHHDCVLHLVGKAVA